MHNRGASVVALSSVTLVAMLTEGGDADDTRRQIALGRIRAARHVGRVPQTLRVTPRREQCSHGRHVGQRSPPKDRDPTARRFARSQTE